MLEVRDRVTDKNILIDLGNKLGLKEHEIDAILQNYKDDIRNAAYKVLQKWRNNEPDAVKAVNHLAKALSDAGLKKVAHEVLKVQVS